MLSTKKEEHAAYQYNLWVDQYKLTIAKKNNVPKPKDFVPWVSRSAGRTLPKNIYKNGKGYQVQIAGRCYGTYATVEEAENSER